MKRPSVFVALFAGTLMCAMPAAIFCAEIASTMLDCPLAELHPGMDPAPCSSGHEMGPMCCDETAQAPVVGHAKRPAAQADLEAVTGTAGPRPVLVGLGSRVLTDAKSRHGPPVRTLFATLQL